MGKYVYPAVFTREKSGIYAVEFPDLEGCVTSGDDLADALYMASDLLAGTLYDYERDGRKPPVPSELGKIKLQDEAVVSYVACDTLWYQKHYNNKAVKKTLTIPEWLNEMASAAGINFSQTLQEALITKLKI